MIARGAASSPQRTHDQQHCSRSVTRLRKGLFLKNHPPRMALIGRLLDDSVETECCPEGQLLLRY
ncbi:hypothetical protein WN51_12244 [Melipona quadrifasciata]|uniref:Uncharacterized protein n=1 Tax=Melipona quadrifasciata TaxID=166423 RepID=A0A0M9A1N1_9HYME|nr:hypothetical protein WN51_12244 [Melipona quadrifasciata]